MNRTNYRIRKLYVILNPFISRHARSQRVQWIMRNSPLVQNGVPFFFEPWVNPGDFFTRADGDYRPNAKQVICRFLREFWSWARCKITGQFTSLGGAVWKWNRKTKMYERQNE